MGRFGQHLVGQGLISREQLEEALQAQVAYGARLGTNLVELGFLRLDDLANQLARFLEAPVPPKAWLDGLDKRTALALPMDMIRRFKILPIRVEGSAIHVAMLDPLDAAQLHTIEKIASRAVKSYSVPELRIHYLLERVYGIKRDVRFINVGREMARGGFAAPSVPAQPPAALPRTERRRVPRTSQVQGESLRALEAHEELTDEESFAATYIRRDAAESPKVPVIAGTPVGSGAAQTTARVEEARVADRPEPAPSPLRVGRAQTTVQADGSQPTLRVEGVQPAVLVEDARSAVLVEDAQPAVLVEDARSDRVEATAIQCLAADFAVIERKLANAVGRDELVDAVLEQAELLAEMASVFVVHQGLVQGMRSSSISVPHRPIDGILLPLTIRSVLTDAAQSGQLRRAKIEELEEDRRILQAMGRTDIAELVVLPIRVRDRVVNLLCVDNGRDPVPTVSFAALTALADLAGAGYSALALRLKRHESVQEPVQDGRASEAPREAPHPSMPAAPADDE